MLFGSNTETSLMQYWQWNMTWLFTLYSLVATVASNCLYIAWPDYIISHPELKAFVHYDSKCCDLVPYVYLWGNRVVTQIRIFDTDGQEELV